jgi:preprotein translocase subunit SecG
MIGSTLVLAVVFGVAGLALGYILTRTIRRRRPMRRREAADARKRAAAPVAYVSRQEARKAQRAREKAERRL